jgi:hypothetical protein
MKSSFFDDPPLLKRRRPGPSGEGMNTLMIEVKYKS